MERTAIFVHRENLISHIMQGKHKDILEESKHKDILEELKHKNILEETKHKNILVNAFIPLKIWQSFNKDVMDYLQSGNLNREFKHMGTWMFVTRRVDMHKEIKQAEIEKEDQFLEHMKRIDSIFGFIVKYGIAYENRKEIRHKGVDVNIVCQMLIGAFEDEYDIAILVSDDDDFIPAVEIVQNFYGKQVFHMGFEPDRLRAACFGNIPLEKDEIFQLFFK